MKTSQIKKGNPRQKSKAQIRKEREQRTEERRKENERYKNEGVVYNYGKHDSPRRNTSDNSVPRWSSKD